MSKKKELVGATEDGSGRLTLTFEDAQGKTTTRTYTTLTKGYARAWKRAKKFHGIGR